MINRQFSKDSGALMQTIIRPEARPVEWELLDREQQRAFDQLAQMIAESIRMLPAPDERSRSSKPVSWLNENRSSRTAFLSGARGSGKTTVLASLTKACELPQRSSPNLRIEEPSYRLPVSEMSGQTRQAL